MNLSLGKEALASYVSTQVNHFFPDGRHVDSKILGNFIPSTLEQLDYCFSHVHDKYFCQNNETRFNHLNSDQYSMFLYVLSHSMFLAGEDTSICTKLFLLNKSLHGIDLYYEVEMPQIFLINHPLGTVLGRGKYSDYFIAHQRCNIGSNKDKFPRLGKYVSLHPGAAVLGDCHIGNNCKISAGSLLMDMDLDENSVYIGTPRDHVMKRSVNTLSIWM